MLHVALPSAATAHRLSIPPTAALSAFDDVGIKLQSTLHGVKEVAALPARRTSMLEGADSRQQVLGDLEASYARDVLELGDGDGEDGVDERLRAEARQLGLEEDARHLAKETAHSTNTVGSEKVRRSESIGSRASRSTGLTSNFSDVSRDPHAIAHRSKPRSSLSFRDYDTFLSRGTLNGGRSSISFSSPPTTPAASTLSLALSSPEGSPKKHFRRLRGLSMLKLHRVGSSSSLKSDGCPHCPQDPISQRRAVHRLPCGHRLCTQALRSTVSAGTQGPLGSVPSCCGIPIPGSLIEHVMTQQEQNALLERLEQWDEAASMTSTRNRASTIDSRASITEKGARYSVSRRPGALTEGSRTVSDESKTDSVSPHSRRELDKAMELPSFKDLREQQEAQRDRLSRWSERIQLLLDTQHSLMGDMLRQRHETAVDELSDQHAIACSEAEDKQVTAEAALRASHTQEKRDNATALKHMEAYCAGTYSTGEPHNRTITDQDRIELDKTRRARDNMDSKHESAINVLRGEQGRRMRMREQRQDKALVDLQKLQRKEEVDLEKGCNAEKEKFRDMEYEKRRRLSARWHVQNAIFLKRLEAETGVVLRGHLPVLEWGLEKRLENMHIGPHVVRSRWDSLLAEE